MMIVLTTTLKKLKFYKNCFSKLKFMCAHNPMFQKFTV